VNEKYAKVVKAMAAYDAAPLGSQERAEAGAVLDKAGSKFDERDRLGAVSEYLKSLSKEDLVRLYGPYLSGAN